MRRKDWADDMAETLYDFLGTGPGDDAIIEKVAGLVREAYADGLKEGAANPFKNAFRGGFGKSAVPG